MKKLIALVLAFVLALSMTAAFAAGSKDTTKVTTVSSTEETNAPLMWKVDLTDGAKELIEKLNAALEAGDISTEFPEELAVSADLIVADVISVEVAPEIADETSYTAEMTGVAGVAKENTARVLALVDEAWFEGKATVKDDNIVDMTFDAETLKAMAAASNITLIVLVDKAE